MVHICHHFKNCPKRRILNCPKRRILMHTHICLNMHTIFGEESVAFGGKTQGSWGHRWEIDILRSKFLCLFVFELCEYITYAINCSNNKIKFPPQVNVFFTWPLGCWILWVYLLLHSHSWLFFFFLNPKFWRFPRLSPSSSLFYVHSLSM